MADEVRLIYPDPDARPTIADLAEELAEYDANPGVRYIYPDGTPIPAYEAAKWIEELRAELKGF